MVYLIHFDQPLKHANHYIGFVERDLDQRITLHRKGLGSAIMRAVQKEGISWSVVRVWDDGDRAFERKLKNRKKARCLCPICRNKL